MGRKECSRQQAVKYPRCSEMRVEVAQEQGIGAELAFYFIYFFLSGCGVALGAGGSSPGALRPGGCPQAGDKGRNAAGRGRQGEAERRLSLRGRPPQAPGLLRWWGGCLGASTPKYGVLRPGLSFATT